MNICLSNSTGIFAGGEDYVLILGKYLKQRGHSVWISANPGHLLLQKSRDAGLEVLPLSYIGMSRVFSVAASLRKELKARSIDIIHSNANYDRTVAAMAAAFLPVKHVASVHSAHSIQHNITHYLRNRFGTAHFIADAVAVKVVMMTEDGIPASGISVIPIGVENDTDDFMDRARAETRKNLNIAPGTVVVGNVARLVPFKGHRHLLQAIAEVTQERTDVLFPIVGDGELQSELEAQAAQLGIRNYVRFLGFQDDLNKLYPAFDIYCHSSLELAAEAFPIAILRALATGLPVVATSVGGIGLMVEEGVSGHLTPPEDPKALARALLSIISQPERMKSMGKESFRLFKKSFHASAMAEQVEEVYQKVLAG